MKKNITIYLLCTVAFIFLLGSAIPSKAQEIKWHSFETAIDKASASNKPILVDIWAPWCGWCYKMKNKVYPKISSELAEQFVWSRLNRDDHDTIHKYRGNKFTSLQLAQKLQTETVPTIVVLNEKGEYLLHISGFLEVQELKPILQYVASKAYRYQTYNEFRKALSHSSS